MEILRFLLSFLTKESGINGLEPILKSLQDNSFDLKKTFANLDFNTLEPILESVMQFANKKSPSGIDGEDYGLTPISNIADKDIIYALNSHFAS